MRLFRKPDVDLTPEEREAISKLDRCAHCAGYHAFTCPYVATGKHDKLKGLLEIEYRPEFFRDFRDQIIYLD